MNPRNPIILCVDDEKANLKLLENILVPRGYTVIRAASGQDALQKIKEQAIDLVLLDVIMPGMDGFEVCRQIKEDPKLRDIPIIMITALTSQEDHVRGIEAGAEEFLTKPIEKGVALARIKLLLRVKQLSDERRRAEKALKKSHNELERRVQERTAELVQANEMLQADITERTRAEQELNESKALMDAVVENVPLMIFLKEATDLRFVIFNRAGEELLGYDRKSLLGKNNLDLFPPEQAAHFMAKDREVLDEKAGMLDIPEESILTAKKGTRLLHTRKVCIRGADGTTKYLLGISEDITERMQAQESIRVSLKEKEVLLKEVHHRVKNNLMTIIGLLKMQETKASNEMFNPLLRELESRVRAMALVHENLHKSEDLVHVDLQNYIEMMIAQIHAQFGAEPDIRFSAQAVGVEVGLDIAVPVGLILNELITNAYKHAFPGDKPRSGARDCEFVVAARHENGIITLDFSDNGVGLPPRVNWENPETIGLQLIQMLSRQINGSIELDGASGTAFRLKFPRGGAGAALAKEMDETSRSG